MSRHTGQQLVTRVLVLSVLLGATVHLASAQPGEHLLLWNRLESEENVENSDYGPGFYLTTYIYDFWEEARIEPAMFGNGLFVNHDTNEGWNNDGANFFALDLWETGLTATRGTIEFWFKFKYDCSFHNHAYLFLNLNELTGHLPGPPSEQNTVLNAAWDGWNYPDRKRFIFAVNPEGPGYSQAVTPAGSAGPGGHLAFWTDELHHFAFLWDVEGIDGSADTVRLYVNGNLEAAATETWDDTVPLRRYFYLGTSPNRDPWDHIHNAVKGVTDNLIIWDYAKTNFADRFVESPFLELVAEVPPTGGIIVNYIPAIQALDSNPSEVVFATQNVNADCGGGTPASAWKMVLDPDTGELVDLSLKQHLTLIQNVRRSLFEASDGTLFTGGGWCLHKPPYYSIDGGESWQPATQGNHPANSNFSYAEFNGEVYLGSGYEPHHGQLWRWLGESSPDHWELLLDLDPPRTIINAIAAYDEQLFVSSCIHWWNGCDVCEGTVPVWVSSDGNTFNATTGIPSCYSVGDLLVVGDDLVARVQDCGTTDYYIYRWRTDLSAWEEVGPYDLGWSWPRLVSREGAIYSYGQAPGDAAAGIYESVDLGQTWQQLATLEDPDATALHIHGDTLYIGTQRDANDIAYIYRMCLEEVLPLALDIKPGSCPNAFNRKSRGVLPVALVGTGEFDVTEVDLDSLTLTRADGVGGSVAPLMGPPGPGIRVEDVATPFEGEPCDCHELDGDGIVDLAMKFRTPEVVAELELSDLPGGTSVELVLSGVLLDETPFSARDCVVLVRHGPGPGVLPAQRGPKDDGVNGAHPDPPGPRPGNPESASSGGPPAP